MISKKSNQNFKLRLVKNYGDASIFLAFCTTTFWRDLFKKDKLALWSLFRDYLRFITAMFANAIGVVFRYRHGSQTMGIILCLFTMALLLIFNSTKVVFFIKPFVFFIVPALPAFMDKQEILDLIFVHYHSKALFVFSIMYLSLAIIHTVIIYIGKGNPDLTKRGDSWLYEWLFKRTGFINEFIVQGFMEPGITAMIGWLFWDLGDYTFAAFLWIGAACTFVQEVVDIGWQEKNKLPEYA